ncbi:MAG: DUF4920 domain-containing protein [Bacteroidota bacterium]
MKKLIFGIVAISLMACGGQPEGTAAQVENEAGAKVEATNYGETFTVAETMSLTDVLNQVDQNGESEVMLEAEIVETCAKAGCWMSVQNPNGSPILVFMKDHDFFVPTEGMMGKKSYIKGTAKRDTLSVDWLQHLAEDANKPQEEIDAITEPEITISITADGVIIEDVQG